MVAYSFQNHFIRDLRARVKQQTIRLPRKRHARAGEAVQFFYGPRMRPTRIGHAMCQAVREVRLDFDANTVLLDDAILIRTPEALDAFAIRDGFTPPERLAGRVSPWDYMSRWWAQTHPEQPVFLGALIDWEGTFVPVEPLTASAAPPLTTSLERASA